MPIQISLLTYRNKQTHGIHSSWFSQKLLWLLRIASVAVVYIRLFLYCCDYSLIYLTIFGFVLTIAYFTLAVGHLVAERVLQLRNSAVSVIADCVGILFEAAFAIELTLTILFWALLSQQGTDLGSFDNLGVHLIPFILLLGDFVLNLIAFPMRHLIVTFILATIYLVVNQVHACNVAPVYSVYECGNVWLPIVAYVMLACIHLGSHFVWKKIKLSAQKRSMVEEEERLV